MTSPTPNPTLDPRSAPPEIQRWLQRSRERVDAELDRRLNPSADDPGRLHAAMHYAAAGGGKRLRPALTLAACAALGGSEEAALPAAVAIELLHAYTLVHDDLPAMDDDAMRRGRPTVHVEFGEATAILAGDALLTAAFAALAELAIGTGAAVEVLARRAGADELLRGQALDLTLKDAVSPPSIETIELLHRGKTGALFAAAVELGGIAGGADVEQRAALARYGMEVGVAFQLADDLDDGDFPALAGVAAARRRSLAELAERDAASLPRGALLTSFARWIGGLG